jgi:hypothetical protein
MSTQDTVPAGCIQLGDGTIKCPDTNASDVCKPWKLQDSRDACIQEDYANEALNIGGATANVYKLLGVHEQSRLVDQTGRGEAISGGELTGFPAANAFTDECTVWRSSQRGDNVTAQSYIGYDFGVIKITTDRQRHGDARPETRDIATIRIKQLSTTNNRATKVRIERSQDGQKWYGVEVVDLADDDSLQTLHIRRSVPSRYWRLRPLEFNGGPGDFWGVVALEMSDYELTRLDNVQDRLLLENRNRDYMDTPIALKVSYDLIDVQTELSRFGIELPSQSYYMTVGFASCVAALGRPFVIGDIIELPSEAQYNTSLDPIKKYLEVVDVGWSTEGYTTGWRPTLLRIITQPMLASQETQDIVGDFARQVDGTGLFNIDDGNHPIFQDYSEQAPRVDAVSRNTDNVPQRGADASNELRSFSEDELQTAEDAGVNIQKLSYNPNGLYVEDAVPPNNEDFTMGDTYPENPSDGDYHRLTYSGVAEDVPARLYRYSSAKGRWIYLETDRRSEFDGTRKKLQEFITHPNAVANNKILDDK